MAQALRRIRSVASSVAIVFLAGCGGGGGDDSSATPVASATQPPAAVTAPAQEAAPAPAPVPAPAAPESVAAPSPAGELPPVDETPSSDPAAESPVAETPAGVSPTDESLGAPAPALPPMPAGSGTVQLSWAAPVENADGTALGTLSGYRIKYGRSQKDLDQSVFISNPSVSSYVVENLQPGVWYFEVVAINSENIEGPPSNQATKTIV